MGILATTRKGVSFRFESRRSSPQPISADSFHATPTKNPANSILLYMNPIRLSNHLADCTRSPLRNEIPDSQTGVLPRKIGRSLSGVAVSSASADYPTAITKKVPAYGFRRPDSKHRHIAGHGFTEATAIKKRERESRPGKGRGKTDKRAEKRVEESLQSKRIS